MFTDCKVIDIGVDSQKYHERAVKRGDPAYPMSPSHLKAFAECPLRWFEGYEPPDSKPKQWGSVLDMIELTPQDFGKRFAVKPDTYPAPDGHEKVKKGLIEAGDPLPWHAGADYCKEWELKHDGFELLSAAVMAECEAAKAKLHADEILHSFSEASQKQVLVQGFWVDKELRIPVQCLIDYVPKTDTEWLNCLGDLKSTRSAGIRPWLSFSKKMRHHLQGAFDLDIFNAATGQMRDTWCFLLVENYAPFRTGRRMLDQSLRLCGARQYKKALEVYAHCLRTGKWPDYDDVPEATQGWVAMPADQYDELDSLSPPYLPDDEDDDEKDASSNDQDVPH